MTRFIHLTDLHISHPDAGDDTLHSDTPGNLQGAVALINAMPVPPEFVVVSGDLTNRGDGPSYALLRRLLAPLRPPLLLALGNHDDRAVFHRVFRETRGEAPYCHDSLQGGLHVIVLDTLVPRKISGALCAGQFDFLSAALARHEAAPKLLVLHHPPKIDPLGPEWACLDGASTERLAGLLRGRRVAGILSGHIHIDRVSHWHNIPLVISRGLHSTIDMLEPKDLRIVEGTGMAICDWRDSGLSVSFLPLSPAARELVVVDHRHLKNSG
ncbi:metallophosphoesterase family protein [Sulfitobacter aestuarii]|uniref:Metallophosphoesterase family protein n=1 Tax=Sulfitobacter aestuarii TaxID=2161676 RepID=A0ABW5U6X3_9RHOB